MKNKFFNSSILIMFFLFSFVSFFIHKADARSRVTCGVDAYVDGYDVTISGHVSENGPELDASYTEVYISDSAGAGSNAGTGQEGASVNYTVTLQPGSYTAYVSGTGQTNPGGATSECSNSTNFTVIDTTPLPVCQDGNATNYGESLPCQYPPPPSVNINANPSSIVSGSSSTLSWSSSNASGCTATSGAPDFYGQGLPTNGSTPVYPTSNTTYRITCYGNNTSAWAETTVSVTQPVQQVMSGTLTSAANTCTIASGASTCNINFSWTTTNPEGTSAVTSNTTNTGANGTTTVGNGNSGTSVSFVVPYNTRNFYLYNNGTLLASKTVTSSCASGTVWSGSACLSNVMFGSLTSSSPSCIIASGASSCNVTLTWSTTHPEGTSAVTASGMTQINGNSGSQSVAVPYSSRIFYLYNNAKSLIPTNESPNGTGLTVTASCTSGTAWNGTSCAQYTVTASAGANGTISPASQTVSHGSTTTFTVTANTHYTASVGGTCGGNLVGTTYTTSAITANCTVVASFTPVAYTVTASASGGNGTISPPSKSVTYGSTTTFSVDPSSGYTPYVTASSGCAGGSLSTTPVNGVYTYTTGTVSSECTVVASFMAGTLSGPDCTIAAGASTCTTTLTFCVTSPQNVGGSSVTSSYPPPVVTPPVSSGTTVDCGTKTGVIIPFFGRTFYLYNNGISLVPSNSGAGVVVNSSCTFGTEWNGTSCAKYTVTPSAGVNGTISPNILQDVAYNATTSFTITPSTGYIPSVSVTPVAPTSSCTGGSLSTPVNGVYTYTTGPVKANCNVIASFSPDTFTVTASAPGGNGTVYPSSKIVNYNNTTTFSVAPNQNYLPSVQGTCGGSIPLIPVPSNGVYTYTTSPITANCAEVISFENNLFTITPSAELHGRISPDFPQNVGGNTVKRFSVIPDNNYIASVTASSGCEGGGFEENTTTYVTGRVTANCTVVASFMAGTLSGSDCVIAAGASSCTTNLSWSITGPQGNPTAITANGMTNINVTNTLVTPQSGVQSVTVPYQSRTFFLYNNSKSLVPSNQSPAGTGLVINSTCALGTLWNNTTGVCANIPPVANAGNDKSITLPVSSVAHTGATANDTAPGTISSVLWSKVSGPATFTITNGATLTPTFSNLSAGTYTFRLTVTDNNGATGTDDMTVTVLAAGVMSGTLTPASSSCSIVAGARSCTTDFSWTTTNPAGTSEVTSDTDNSGFPSPGFVVASGNNGGPVPFAIPYINNNVHAGRNFYLYNNGTLLAQSTAMNTTSECTSGTVWSDTTASCVVPSTMTGAISSPNCTIVAGASSCTTTIDFCVTAPDTKNGSAVTSNTNNGGVSSTGFSITPPVTTGVVDCGMKTSVTVPYPSRNFYLYNSGIGLTQSNAAASCIAGTTWSGTNCAIDSTSFLSVDLKVNGGDYNTTQTALNVTPGDTITFSWSSTGNTSLGCWSTDGASGDGWTSGSMSHNSSNHQITAPNTIGTYKYALHCKDDRDLGVGKMDKILAYFNPFKSASAVNWVTVTDTVWITVSPVVVSCQDDNSCGCSGDSCRVTSGGNITVSWECPAVSTASVGIGFNTDLNNDGAGDVSGSVVLTPTTYTEYSVVCNNGGGGGFGGTGESGSSGPIRVIVSKKPFYIEN